MSGVLEWVLSAPSTINTTFQRINGRLTGTFEEAVDLANQAQAEANRQTAMTNSAGQTSLGTTETSAGTRRRGRPAGSGNGTQQRKGGKFDVVGYIASHPGVSKETILMAVKAAGGAPGPTSRSIDSMASKGIVWLDNGGYTVNTPVQQVAAAE
jgi:hypothetical protein